jgi:hypothetical protein
MTEHPAKTLFADRVVYYTAPGKGDVNWQPHVAFVIRTHDDDPHMACLAFYCPDTHAWHEAYNVPFGDRGDGGVYFTNPKG